ncbi:MAG: 5-(carboxyamino)imidazole ribonucleotide synthase [Acidobacteriota bacterium]
MTKRNLPILPGSAIGVLGSGQLGRMFAIAARRMGYRVHTLSPETDTPTGQVADVEITSPYDDLDVVRRFAAGVSVVTFEFENVPALTAQAAAEQVPVRPSGAVLHVTQNRLREKIFLTQNGIPVPLFRRVTNAEELRHALSQLGVPAVLKTAGYGYDGKGQVKITSLNPNLPPSTFESELVLETFVDFDSELSVIGARGLDGTFAHWGPIRNTHTHHILDISSTPAELPETTVREAIEITRCVLEQLDVVGVLCVEFFLAKSGRLLVNELAPRPHNSGHLTFDACLTSQFEQQLRAVCALPLGSTTLLRPAAMANLLGDLWQEGEPNWPAACSWPDVKLHLYGKLVPKSRRKMGHLTAMAESVEDAVAAVRQARNSLKPGFV